MNLHHQLYMIESQLLRGQVEAALHSLSSVREELKASSKNVSPRQRRNETIGGGFFVFRRGKKTGRISVNSTLPFEHGCIEDACEEAKRLVKKFNGKEKFAIFKQMAEV